MWHDVIMKAIRLEIELPGDLLSALNVAPESLPQKAKEWIALELYREGQISSGKAAEIMNLSKGQFIDLLTRHDIPYLDLPAGELKSDLAILDAFTSESHR